MSMPGPESTLSQSQQHFPRWPLPALGTSTPMALQGCGISRRRGIDRRSTGHRELWHHQRRVREFLPFGEDVTWRRRCREEMEAISCLFPCGSDFCIKASSEFGLMGMMCTGLIFHYSSAVKHGNICGFREVSMGMWRWSGSSQLNRNREASSQWRTGNSPSWPP